MDVEKEKEKEKMIEKKREKTKLIDLFLFESEDLSLGFCMR